MKPAQKPDEWDQMTDLIEALRNPLLVTDERFDLTREAAAEIKRLRAALHEAQEFIRSYPDMPEGVSRWILDVIKAALAGKVQP